MCDDLDSEPPEDEQPEEPQPDPEDHDELLADVARELFGDEPAADVDAGDAQPSSGERVLYALGQLHRMRLAGRLPVEPSVFGIEDIARIVGVAGDLEFVTKDRSGEHFHFPAEVLHVDPGKPFPWRLLGVWEWAALQEADASWTEGWD